jgi:hypothetical protein
VEQAHARLAVRVTCFLELCFRCAVDSGGYGTQKRRAGTDSLPVRVLLVHVTFVVCNPNVQLVIFQGTKPTLDTHGWARLTIHFVVRALYFGPQVVQFWCVVLADHFGAKSTDCIAVLAHVSTGIRLLLTVDARMQDPSHHTGRLPLRQRIHP